MEGLYMTDQGQVRRRNEDSGGVYCNQHGQLIAVIADGMGGHQAGDVASSLAISFIEEKWETAARLESPSECEQWLTEAIQEINSSIYENSLQNKKREGMGTTIVITVCTEEYITVAHVGDSRCYLLNENGFKQITADHTLVNELVRHGQITRDDAEQHPRKHVLVKAMGTEKAVAGDIQTIEWEEGDKLLLCSDGLSDKVMNDELAEFLKKGDNIRDTGGLLINLANERGGEDNISLVLIQHESTEKAGENE